MSTVIDNARLTSTANIAGLAPISSTLDVVGEIPFVMPSAQTEIFLKLFISDFNSEFHLLLVGIDFSREQSVCELKTALVDGAFLVIRLNGKLDEDKNTFRIKQVSIGHELTSNRALPKFVALTFGAMLPLANAVTLKMPEIGLNLTTTFEFPLKELSRILQNRQLAYRVMVIEKALGIEFKLPSDYIGGEEVETIAYAYHTIVEREFDWPCNSMGYIIVANQESQSWLPPSEKLPPTEFPPMPTHKKLFDHDLYLGQSIARLEESIIENYDDVKQKLSFLDGHLVNLVIRPLDGRVRIETLDAPRLPDNPWEPRIQQLIDLDSQLDAEMVRRFNELVASTLDGLSEEMKIAVTTTPEIDDMFFSFEDERE
jgi:hypothetical protein